MDKWPGGVGTAVSQCDSPPLWRANATKVAMANIPMILSAAQCMPIATGVRRGRLRCRDSAGAQKATREFEYTASLVCHAIRMLKLA